MSRPAKGYRAKGVPVPGVTTILGRYKDSGALMQWSFQQGKLAERGIIRHLYDTSDSAKDIGSAVHEAAEAVIKGEDWSWPQNLTNEEIEKADAAMGAFTRWRNSTKIEITDTEMPLVSLKHKFGGTPDAIGKIGDVPVLLDFKTSKGIYRDYALQLGAYAILLAENGYTAPVLGQILVFSKVGRFQSTELTQSQLRLCAEAFLSLRSAYALDQKVKTEIEL